MLSSALFPILLSLVSATKTIQFSVFTDQKKLANQPILLLSLDEGPQKLDESTTNKNGIAFFKINPDKNKELVATVAIAGVAFFSQRIFTSDLSSKAYPIQIFEPSTDASVLKITSLEISLSQKEGSLFVEESFNVFNPSNKTIVGKTTESNPEQSEVFRIQIPENAYDLRYGFGFQEGEVRVDSDQFVVMSPVFPGNTFFSLSYGLDGVRRNLNLTRSMSIPIQSIELALGSRHFKLQKPRLEMTGQKFFDNQVYRVFKSEGLNTHSIDIVVSGLPWNVPTTWWMPFLGLVLLLAIGFLVSSTNRSFVDQSQRERQKRHLLKQWSDIQTLFKKGVISKDNYLQRKLSLLRELSIYYDK